jgi:hypothetical protein
VQLGGIIKEKNDSGSLLYLHYNYHHLAAEDASASLYIRLRVVYALYFSRMVLDIWLQICNHFEKAKLQYGI